MNEDSEPEFARYEIDTEGVYISDDGYYTCEECEEVLEATGDVDVTDGRKRGIFRCPECGDEFPC